MNNDRESTQDFAVFDILVNNCGQNLTPALIDNMRDMMKWQMREGPCAWAFKPDTADGSAAPQHHGEPVAWFTDDHLTDKSATTWDSTVAERWREKGWPVSQLYAHADTGEVADLRAVAEKFGRENAEYRSLITSAEVEVERLRAANLGLIADNKMLEDECNYGALRAQLAEREALLRDAREELVCRNSPIAKRIDAALSASAEPSAIPFPGYPPVPEDRKLPAEPSAPVEGKHPFQKCLEEHGVEIGLRATVAQQAQMIEYLKEEVEAWKQGSSVEAKARAALEHRLNRCREVLQKLRRTVCLPEQLESMIDEALKS